MNALKQSCKSNWYVIASTFLMAVCTGVLTGIMEYNIFPDTFDLPGFLGESALKIAVLVVGAALSFAITAMFNHKFSGIFAAMFTVFAVLCSDIFLGVNKTDGWFYFSFFAAVIMLMLYYENACFDSTGHTVFYYILLTALTAAAAVSDDIEFFVILLTAVIMFAVNRESISPKSALVINYVFSVFAIIAMVCMLVAQMDDYFGIKFIEGDRYHLESLYLTTKPFGEAEYYHVYLENSSIYNLAKIFRHFGYVAGTAMCVLITFFALSFFAKCFGNSRKSHLLSIFAAMTISVKCIAGFFENFTIISGMRVVIPLLSDDITGYLLVGIMLGFMLVSDEIIDGMVNTSERIFQEIFKKDEVTESDKPHLTLVVPEENDDV